MLSAVSPCVVVCNIALQNADGCISDNIDYDDIKLYIKDQTTPGKGKTVAVPGRGDDRLLQFENALFAILSDQHHRIDLFVRSKAGEIRRRLDHSKRQLTQLAARTSNVADQRIPVGRLERYGRLENDVLKAGDEIRSLARFTSAQRTAFRKLLKKYKKWTGSEQLEERFREEVLGDPKSFTRLDLGPLLDDYSSTLLEIRTLYEKRISQASTRGSERNQSPSTGSSVISRLHTTTESGSKVEFDTAIATIPLGEHGTFASYFVHPENVVELQVLVLQHARYYLSRSRSNSLTTPVSTSPIKTDFAQDSLVAADYFALEADDAERFAQEQNALTINDREHRQGSAPQKAKLCTRWNNDEEAQAALRVPGGSTVCASMKKKFAYSLLDRNAAFSHKKAATSVSSEQAVLTVRSEMENDPSVQPLYLFSSSRTRFVGNDDSHQKATLATFDTGMVIQKAGSNGDLGEKSSFPFGVLLVRQEGAVTGGLLAALDQSHLVERVRGFSLEYHAIWETSKLTNFPPPFWLPILSRDIRKLPPPAIRLTRSGTQSSTSARTPGSMDSREGVTDGTTAVETTRSDSITQPEELAEIVPIRSFRKKRRRGYPEQPTEQGQRYWSEYDHPEDGDGNGESAYVIYIDPDEKSTFDLFVDKIGSLFSRRKKPAADEEAGLLTEPSSPKDDASSSDEEVTSSRPKRKSYGTILTPRITSASAPEIKTSSSQHHYPSAHQVVTISFAASLVILGVAYILAATGRHKYAYEVYFGVIFAAACSLVFAILGFATVMRQADVAWPTLAAGISVLIVDAIASGGLLAWMLG